MSTQTRPPRPRPRHEAGGPQARGRRPAGRRRRPREGVLRVARLARGRRLPDQRGLPGPAVHAARLAGVDHLRHRRHLRRPRIRRQPPARRRRHRGGARRADRARRRRVRGLPRPRRSATPARTAIPGKAPDGQSYGSFATFSDPDGNEFLLQEVTTRLPGRVEEPDIEDARAAAARDRPRPRPLRGGHPGAQLVGLVRPLLQRAPAGRHAGAGDRGGRPVHEGGPWCGSPMSSAA